MSLVPFPLEHRDNELMVYYRSSGVVEMAGVGCVHMEVGTEGAVWGMNTQSSIVVLVE